MKREGAFDFVQWMVFAAVMLAMTVGPLIYGCARDRAGAEAEPLTRWQVTLYSGGHVIRRWTLDREPFMDLNAGRVHVRTTMIHGTYVVEKVR